MSRIHKKTGGEILVLIIIFTSIFSILLASLIRFLVTRHTAVQIHNAEDQAFQMAEAGVEYYRWHLAHSPDDLQDGTGEAGPYVHDYVDPEGGTVGHFSLELGGEVLCGKTQVVHATSTGWTVDHPEIKRIVFVRIARPTIADYSYIVDGNVYAGSNRIITGPYHGNGVIRMDADNRSAVTSKVATASCAVAGLGGCAGTVSGVYGAGSHPEWWKSAQPDIPFSNFEYDAGELETIANDHGIFLPKVSNGANRFGYYLVLKADRTVDIYQVTGRWANVSVTSPSMDTLTIPELAGNMNTYRTFVRNEALPSTCPLIYAKDTVWLEGIASGKVTIVANDTGAPTPDVYLQNNITYANPNGDGLAVLAERNIFIPLYVPADMTLKGIFIAQKGAYGRPYYGSVAPYNAYRTRNLLTTTGTIVSKLRTGTSWTDGQAFTNRVDNYDRTLVDAPPPLTPFTSSDFRLIEWREVK
jgi:hypothetical protein